LVSIKTNDEKLIVGVEEAIAADGKYAGGKGSSLARLFRILGKDNVPYAIMVTTEFAKVLLNDENVVKLVKKLDEALAKNNEEEARKIASKIRNFIENIKIQPKLIRAVGKKIRDDEEEGWEEQSCCQEFWYY